jgi:phage terminase large subunit
MLPQNPAPKAPESGRASRRAFAAALQRSRAELVPPAFQEHLWQKKRFIVSRGGRACAKSWSTFRKVLLDGMEAKHLILCCRETQSSIKESAYRLLCNQVRELGLEDFYTILADKLVGRNGTEIIFEGIYRNADKLRSYEDFSIVVCEEAQRISERSWEDLIPTIRKPGHKFYIIFNPSQESDPVWQRFCAVERADTAVRHFTWRDNPHLAPEMIAEKDWCAATDMDQYRFVWEGEFRTVSEAQILRGKFVSEDFEVDPRWSGPHFGLDLGFSQDPTAGTMSYIDDEEMVLYIAKEYWRLAADIDRLPADLEAALPGVSGHTLYCDSARPETISYISRHGIPGARAAEKWSGSILDGIAALRSFSKIVIHPDCVHALDEAARYSYKVDRLTGNPLPVPEDRHNHIIDSIRYGIWPVIRNRAAASYFSRPALLLRGEPIEPQQEEVNVTDTVFLTVASCDRPGTAVAAITWGIALRGQWVLTVLDWNIAEVHEALTGDWVMEVLERAYELRKEWRALDDVTVMHVEDKGLYDRLEAVLVSEVIKHDPVVQAGGPALYGLRKVEPRDVRSAERKDLVTLDDRAGDIRNLINSGHFVKIARSAYGRQVMHRSTADHFNSQLWGYRPGMQDTAQELTAAFLLGCFLSREPT